MDLNVQVHFLLPQILHALPPIVNVRNLVGYERNLSKDILFPSVETVNLDILLRNITFTILLTSVAAAVHNLAKKTHHYSQFTAVRKIERLPLAILIEIVPQSHTVMVNPY